MIPFLESLRNAKIDGAKAFIEGGIKNPYSSYFDEGCYMAWNEGYILEQKARLQGINSLDEDI